MIVYKNTKNHRGDLVDRDESFGLAYETDDYFVHHYCDSDWWINRHRIYQRKTGSLREWAVSVFGAIDVQDSNLPHGTSISQVWRPTVYYNEEQDFLGNTKSEFGICARSLIILLQKLSDIFDYVEPTGDGLKAFGHKSRELLILACTEVENHWVHYLKAAGVVKDRYSTNDYVTLKSALHLSEYKVIRDRLNLAAYFPFSTWNATQPTRSLDWYDAYNKVKHDRNENFSMATVETCINSVAACSVLFAARFGPMELSGNLTKLSGLFNELFSIELDNPDLRTFYIPTWSIDDLGNERLCHPMVGDPEMAMQILPFTI